MQWLYFQNKLTCLSLPPFQFKFLNKRWQSLKLIQNKWYFIIVFRFTNNQEKGHGKETSFWVLFLESASCSLSVDNENVPSWKQFSPYYFNLKSIILGRSLPRKLLFMTFHIFDSLELLFYDTESKSFYSSPWRGQNRLCKQTIWQLHDMMSIDFPLAPALNEKWNCASCNISYWKSNPKKHSNTAKVVWYEPSS